MFAQQTQFPVEVRALAGLILKNELKRNSTIWDRSSDSGELLMFIHDSFLPCLDDANKLVRSTSAHVLAMLVSKTPLLKTSRVIMDLVDCVRQPNFELRDGASLALLFIAEDCPLQVLDSDEAGRPLNLLVPFWIECFSTPTLPQPVRERALQCLQQLLYSNPPALQFQFASFMQHLAKLLGDGSVNRMVLETITLVMEVSQEDEISPAMFLQFVHFALQSLDGGDHLQRDACEFFEASLRHSTYAAWLEQADGVIAALVPRLLIKLVYADEDLFEMEADMRVDSHLPDSLQDVLPPRADTDKYLSPIEREEEEEEDDANDGDDKDGDEEPNASPYWTTRKIAGLILDTLSKQTDANAFLALLMPTLSRQLQSHDWKHVEAAILCVGAVAESPEIRTQLLIDSPQLVGFLCQQATSSPFVLVRRICLWTLSRFAPVICHSQELLPMVLQALVGGGFNDGNKKTQSAALVALRALLVQPDNVMLAGLLPELIPTLVPFLAQFQVNNTILLLDCLAEVFPVGSEVDLWSQTGGSAGLEFCAVMLTRFQSMEMTHPGFDSLVLVLVNAYSFLPSGALPNDQAMQRCLAMLQSAPSAYEVSVPLLQLVNSLVTSGCDFPPAPLLPLVCEIALAPNQYSDLVEVALGVLGDVCAYCPLPVFAHLQLEALFMRVAEELDESAPDKQRNAIWAMVELIKSGKQALHPQTMERLVLNLGHLLLLRERRSEWVLSLGDLCAIALAQLVLKDMQYFTHCFLQVGEKDSDVKEAVLSWTKIVIRMSEQEPARPLAIRAWSLFVQSQLALVGAFVSIVLATIATLDCRHDAPTHLALAGLVQGLQREYHQDWPKKLKPLSPAAREQLQVLYSA